jgi:hypothetical protein
MQKYLAVNIQELIGIVGKLKTDITQIGSTQ